MIGIAVLIVGALSALMYGYRRRWLDALLVAVAALALAAMLAGLQRSPEPAEAQLLDTSGGAGLDNGALADLSHARAISLRGDGLREAEWRDLPARPLTWKPDAGAELLWLDFPRSLALGRVFRLDVRRGQPRSGWRLQLLAENQQVLAETAAAGSTDVLSLQWIPPLAERLLLQARLLDAGGKTIAQGPLPLEVREALPLHIEGRFGAPSFDVRALNQLLADGNAILDWQLTLGKAIARRETARAELGEPHALLADAAYVEQLAPAARAALLARVARGLPLIVLGANASDAAFWQREMALHLQPQSATAEQDDLRQFGSGTAAMALTPASLQAVASPAGASQPGHWSVQARDQRRQPWLWQRPWQQGRIVWIGVSDWHKYAISAPQTLAQWWQEALDHAGVASVEKFSWRLSDPMPLPALRTTLCAQGALAGAELVLAGAHTMRWQARADQADAACVALWPAQPGWLTHASQGQGASTYVYARGDWPAWQRALRRDATARYAARTPVSAPEPPSQPVPAWPFGLLFGLCMLGLWWREQR
ncbi:hypothetical protein HSX11_18300 [Oxalobacteraceae bacterium]|nr:hypothetical protein [Oxalobacteraceae bacterium]